MEILRRFFFAKAVELRLLNFFNCKKEKQKKLAASLN